MLDLLNRVKGSILGLACGDYLGMPFESKDSEVVNKHLDLNPLKPEITSIGSMEQIGYYTDDTAMMLCLAVSLIEKGFDVKDQFRRYKKWAFNGYLSADGKRAFGIGKNTLNKLMTQKEDAIPNELDDFKKEGGNGALMRCLPIGLIYGNIDEIVDKSIKSAIVTHNNEVAAWSCVVFNTLISYCLQSKPKDKLLNELQQESFFKKLPKEISDLIQNMSLERVEGLSNSGYSLNTLKIALVCFLKANSYPEAIELSIRIGGDADTQAAVTGALAGAYYGQESIPEAWRSNLMNYDLIASIAEKIYKLHSDKM